VTAAGFFFYVIFQPLLLALLLFVVYRYGRSIYRKGINWKSINKTWANSTIVAVTLLAGYHTLCACGGAPYPPPEMLHITATTLEIKAADGEPLPLRPNISELRAKAQAGDTSAQNQLGLLYRDGVGGVKKNNVEAYFWYSVSNSILREPIGKSLSERQKAMVAKRVAEWIKAHPAPAAAEKQ